MPETNNYSLEDQSLDERTTLGMLGLTIATQAVAMGLFIYSQNSAELPIYLPRLSTVTSLMVSGAISMGGLLGSGYYGFRKFTSSTN